MFVKIFSLLLIGSAFFQSYTSSDLLGRCIYLSLIFTSVLGWTILLHKIWFTRKVKKNSEMFYSLFLKQKGGFFHLDQQIDPKETHKKELNPFFDLFQIIKKQTIDLLNKNRPTSSLQEKVSYLSPSDIGLLEGHLAAAISKHIKALEENLFILSTLVGLGPLIGLLGTVWGILNTFASMENAALSTSSQAVLGGIALALTTTVLGLLTAIPALIGYNYLKNGIHHFETEMEGFSHEMLSCVEMQYRKVDVN